MSDLLKELQGKLDAYETKYWKAYENEDPPKDDSEEDMGSLSQAWGRMYSGWDIDPENPYREVDKPFLYALPGVGTVEVVADDDDHDDGHALYVIFKYKDHYFRYQGWDDSWSGDGGWEGPLEEVEPKQVTTTVWSKV